MKSLKYGSALALVVALTLTSCSTQAPEMSQNSTTQASQKMLPSGTYDVQSVSYIDVDGNYEIFLLNPPAGSRSAFSSSQVKMARISDQAITQGKKSYLEVKDNVPTLYLTPDFQIAYTHSETQEQVNQNTGQRETVVVRQESSFWTPFLASMAGSAIGNSLFAPRYYVPPVYAPGRMMGYGGYGATPGLATQSYQQRYGSLPPATRLSTSGSVLRRSPSSSSSYSRSTGFGSGSSRLRTNTYSAPRSSGRSFGFGRRR